MERSIGESFSVGKNTGEKSVVMKHIRVAVFLCFIIGIVSANMMDKEELNEFGVWNSYFIEKFKYTHINSRELFWHVFEIRMPIFILLLLLAVTEWGTIAGSLFLVWQGFAAGFLMAVAIIAYGTKGILLVGTAAFPHYLIYAPIYIFYIHLADFFNKHIQTGIRKKGKNIILYMGIFILFSAVYMIGIFLESYINPYLFQKILGMF